MAILEFDLVNQKCRIMANSEESANINNYRFETYGYVDQNKNLICILVKFIHKKYGYIGISAIGADKEYQRYKMDYISTLEMLDYSAIEEYKPPLIYNLDIAVEAIKDNKNIYIVDDERFANYLQARDFDAITILDGLKRDGINKDTLKVLKNANVYYIGKDLPFNIQKILKDITNKFTILSEDKEFVNEFGENHDLLKVVQAYKDYEDIVKDTIVLPDIVTYSIARDSKEKITLEIN